MTTKRLLAVSVFAALLSAPAPAALAATSLRVATLAPKASSWGKIMRTWEKAIDTKTAGQVKLDIYYNGVHGMEDSMVAKMRTGQLDGAVLSSVGLSNIYRDVLLLQLPGLFADWATLDRVRDAMSPELKKGFDAAGFSVLSWGDVGKVRPFSNGFAVRNPSDLTSRHPVVYRDDPILPQMYQTIGGVVPMPSSVMEVLPALRSGGSNVVLAPALAVEQLQWAPHLDHVTDWTLVCVIGGTVFRKPALESMSADLRATFLDIQTKVGGLQTHLVRKDDDDAYERVSKKMQVTTLDDKGRATWATLTHEVVKRLSQSTFPKDMVERVAALAGQPL